MVQALRVRDGKPVSIKPDAVAVQAFKDWSENHMPFTYDMWPGGSDAHKRKDGLMLGFNAFGRTSYGAGRSVRGNDVLRAGDLKAGAEVFADVGRTTKRGKNTVTIYDRVVVDGRDASVGDDFLEQPVGEVHLIVEKGSWRTVVPVRTGPKGDVKIDLPGEMFCVPMDVDWYHLTGQHVQVTALQTPGRVLVLGNGYGWVGHVWRIGRVAPTSLRDGVYVPSGLEDGSWVPALIVER